MEEGRVRPRPWLNVVLFVVTCLSAFYVGLSWSVSYLYSDRLASDARFSPPAQAFADLRTIELGVVYAVVLILILLGHEMGHYLTCRRYRLDATLPFFIPAPTLIGTLGAFIRIKSPITRKKHLFDIGVAGPLVGFALSLPALVYGLSQSRIVPALPRDEAIVFGEPLLLKLIEGLLFRNAPAGSDLFLHPVGFAGWVGILVTSFNLFPIGQLDGGHVSYALIGPRSKAIGQDRPRRVSGDGGFLLGRLAGLGVDHPPLGDEAPQGRGRSGEPSSIAENHRFRGSDHLYFVVQSRPDQGLWSARIG